jgi:hypothetical protein
MSSLSAAQPISLSLHVQQCCVPAPELQLKYVSFYHTDGSDISVDDDESEGQSRDAESHDSPDCDNQCDDTDDDEDDKEEKAEGEMADNEMDVDGDDW